MLEGKKFEYGSLEESIAIYAQQKLDKIRILEIESIVSALAVVAEAAYQPERIEFGQTVKTIERMKDLYFPELALERKAKDAKFANMMEKELNKVLRVTIPASASGKKHLTKKG